MHILLLAATPFEIAPLRSWLDTHFQQRSEGLYEKASIAIQIMVTGVGCTATAFHLGQYLANHRPNWAINAGIAGAFDAALNIGDVVQIIEERFGDLGVEEADGRFLDLAELGFSPNVVHKNPQPVLPGLIPCRGLTVNKVHGTAGSIQNIRDKYPDVQVESMEGAAFFYACLAARIPFSEIRSISNRVEPRNREAWDLPLSIKNLNEVLIELFHQLITPG